MGLFGQSHPVASALARVAVGAAIGVSRLRVNARCPIPSFYGDSSITACWFFYMAGGTGAQRPAHTPQLPLGLFVLQGSMSLGAQGPPWGQLLRIRDSEFVLSVVSQDGEAGRVPKSRIWRTRTGALGERGCCW